MTVPAKRRVFDAVFPTAAYTTSATPAATPVLGSAAFGVSFLSTPEEKSTQGSPAAETIKWERAWHVVTDFLALPREIRSPGRTESKNLLSRHSSKSTFSWFKPWTADVFHAIAHLLRGSTAGSIAANQQQNVFEWYLHEVGRHFLDYEYPKLLELMRVAQGSDQIGSIVEQLQETQCIYIFPLDEYILPRVTAKDRSQRVRFLESYHAIVQQTILRTTFSKHLREYLSEQSALVLGIEPLLQDHDEDAMSEDGDAVSSQARKSTLSLLERLQAVGLGGSPAQVIFAEVMSDLLTLHVDRSYAEQWTGPSGTLQKLQTWIEDCFARFVVEVLAILDPVPQGQEGFKSRAPQVTLADVYSWQQRAIRDLGSLRIKEMFDIVVGWESNEANTRGAIEDLRPYLKTPAARSHLTSSFSKDVSTRLLQPGASTAQILQVYICIVHAFAFLDSKGVLLDRVARPIREYLREREDTVKIIVGGLLADPEADKDNPDILVDLAIELNKTFDISGDDDGEDWDDMSWVPDPVDASLDYQKLKASDVVGTLISLFETKDVFVKEFQVILGSRLLKNELDLDKEAGLLIWLPAIRVLELLKLRFGEAPLQACEVMLRDILDSRRVDAAIRRDQSINVPLESLSFHSRILSRLFWPSLHAENFVIPPAIQSVQDAYSRGFETLKASRKLTWLPTLGQVTVELQLDDRVVMESCQTWQASVIDAFTHASATNSKSATTMTVEDLMAKLEMSEALVQNALTFWVSKLVLLQSSPHNYTVLERLPLPASTTTLATNDSETHATTTTTTSTALIEAAASAAAASADIAASSAAAATGVFSSAEASAKDEQLDVVWQYVQHMLKNGGAMPAARIVRMLNMTIPGGSSLTTLALKDFLGEKVAEGKLELGQGGYKLVK